MRSWLFTVVVAFGIALPVGAQPAVVAVYAVPAEVGSVAQPAVAREMPKPDGSDLHYHVRIDGLSGVRDGSVLVAFRRVPSARGAAPFREDPVWLESGRLQVLAVGNGWATARQILGTPHPLLPSLDADGLPLERICIGDRVVDAGQVGLSDHRVIGRFDLELLFGPGGDALVDGGREALAMWLSRFAVDGAIQVDVSLPGGQQPSTGTPPTTDEAVSGVALRAGSGWSDIRRTEEELAIAQRRARSLAAAVEAALGREQGHVLATVSWTGQGVSEAQTATIRLGRATVLPHMRPHDGGDGAAGGDRVDGGTP
jgi:hypothetical protein